jgi:hypothetical protein
MHGDTVMAGGQWGEHGTSWAQLSFAGKEITAFQRLDLGPALNDLATNASKQCIAEPQRVSARRQLNDGYETPQAVA